MKLSATLCFLLTSGCTCTEIGPPRGVAIKAPFIDRFDHGVLGTDWHSTTPEAYRLESGELVARAAYNHPLWLVRPIPRDAVIEFDCWSASDDGDLKVEAWGDGRSAASGDRRAAYTSTAYNFIFGGWHNQLSTLARLHEHGEDRQLRREPRVVRGQRYHWRIARQGRRIEWSIDGQPFLSFDDPQPLEGDDHRFFGVNDWEAEVHFDNLSIAAMAP